MNTQGNGSTLTAATFWDEMTKDKVQEGPDAQRPPNFEKLGN